MTERVIEIVRQPICNPESIRVLSLVDIPKLEPFVSESSLSVIMDLDGVLCGRGKDNTFEVNIEKLIALREIVEKSKEIMFYSSRIPVNEKSVLWRVFGPAFERQSVTTFPFLTRESGDRLSGYIKSCNPNCNIIFNLNGEFPENKKDKKDQSKEVYDYCFRSLRQNRDLVIIGSNLFDKKEAQQIAEVMVKNGYDGKRIFCFNTGHWLV